MSEADQTLSILERREKYRDWYLENKDPISADRHQWQAHSFRHLVHLLPEESILELGSGLGLFTQALLDMTRGRNPITAARFAEAGPAPGTGGGQVENIRLTSFPGVLEGRRFRYVVVQNILDRETVSFLMSRIYDILEDGGRVVGFESNPWNLFFIARNLVRSMFGMSHAQSLISQPELYELISEIGFIRVSARFTDFIYAPLPRALMRVFGILSTILENTPLLRTLSGRILIHAQKPPREVAREAVSLCRHDALRDSVSVVVPCFNEEMNIGPLVDGLLAHYGDYIHQIVLVDDNSTDSTRAVIEGLAAKYPFITPLLRTPPNGVGHAIREGYQAATGAYVLSMDCDFQDLLPELEDMFDAAAEGYDAVLGSRFSRHSVLVNYPIGKILANRAFHLLFNILFRRGIRDATNNLKLMRIGMVRKLTLVEPWFAVNAEVGLQLVLLGGRLKEVPISWINRTFDMGHSSFRVLRAGGGYVRVLGRLAWETWFGLRMLRIMREDGNNS